MFILSKNPIAKFRPIRWQVCHSMRHSRRESAPEFK